MPAGQGIEPRPAVSIRKEVMKALILALFIFPTIALAQVPVFTQAEIEAVAEKVGARRSAERAFRAHGGEKLKAMKTLVLRGSAEVSGSPSQTFPAGFVMVFAGERYYLEISNPFQPLKQVYDGTSVSSSLPGFQLPPVNRLGLPMLQKIGEEGYKVSPLPAKSRKKKGFRVTAPDGYICDFFVDEDTGAVKAYEAEFDFNGRTVTTSVEVDGVREVEGVRVPDRYSQRFELGFITVYTSFKAKEVLVNSTVEDSVFLIK